MGAEIIRLCDFRPAADDLAIDLVTAVDVAIRDLRDIRQQWGSETAYQRIVECEAMLQRAFNEQ